MKNEVASLNYTQTGEGEREGVEKAINEHWKLSFNEKTMPSFRTFSKPTSVAAIKIWPQKMGHCRKKRVLNLFSSVGELLSDCRLPPEISTLILF